MNRQVLRGLSAVMRDYWEQDRALFERDIFREWMKGLNRRGGVVLLDALTQAQLIDLLREEAKRALSSGAANDGQFERG